MSVSLFRWTEDCDQDPMCVGDCDLCRKEVMEDKYDEVGIPTIEVGKLERVSNKKAKPMVECVYPKCEECDKYHGSYCTVPMVVSKQTWLLTEAIIVELERRLTELETIVTDEILRSKETHKIVHNNPDDNPNYTWADYFKGEEQ